MPKKYFYLLIIFSFCSILGLIKPNLIKAATLSLSPSSGSYTVGDTFEVQIVLDTQGTETDGVDIHYLNYDPSLLEVQDANTEQTGIQISPGTLYSNTPINSVDTVNGRIDFSQTTAGGSTYNGSGVLATVTFKVLSGGTANVTFDFTLGETTDTNVASSGEDVLTSVTNGSYTLSSGNGNGGNGGNGGSGGGGGGGVPSTDTTPPGKVKNLSAIASSTKIILSWTNPSDSDFAGVLIRRSQESAPTTISEGIQIMKEKTTTFTDTGLTNGLTYYYSLFTYDYSGNYSSPVSISVVPQATSTSTTPAITFADGSLLKGSGPKVYLIKSGKRCWITTAEIFTGLGYQWSSIMTVSEEVLNSIPEGEPITSLTTGIYPDGTLLQVSGRPEIYVVIKNKKRHIPTPEIFNNLGYRWSDIQLVTQAELDAIPRVKLVRAENDFKVYYLNQTPKGIMKRWLITPEVFFSYGNKWEDVVVISPQERDFYPSVNLVKLRNDPKIYYLEGTTKYWIPSSEVFQSRGYDWDRVVIVNQIELEAYQYGGEIK